MKTQVIQLERHDDVSSIADRIAGSKGSRVLIVWPKRGRVLYRPLDLLLIQRACQREGSQLACVADDDDVLDHAKELGIPVFRSPKVAQRLPWRRLRRRKLLEPHPMHPREDLLQKRDAARFKTWAWEEKIWVRWMAFILGLVAVLALALFYVPEAKIELVMAQDQQSIEIPVWASPELQSVSLSGGIPAQNLSSIVEGQETLQTSGTMMVPESVATGLVQFTNLTDQPVTVPSDTLIQTTSAPGITFATQHALSLEGSPGSTGEVAIDAVQAGSQGNVDSGSIQAVIGALGTQVTVTNPEPTAGGRDVATRTASQQDIDQLRNRLIASLKSNALNELQSTIGAGDRFFPQTVDMVKIQDETLEPAQGLPAEQVTLTLRVEFQGWSIRQADERTIGLAALDGSLPKGKVALEDSFQIHDLGQPEMIAGQLRWKIQADRLVQAEWDHRAILQAVAGKSLRVAQANLAHLPGTLQPPEISLSPTWWPVVSLIPARIQVEVK